MSGVLRLEGIHAGYHEIAVLEDVSFDLPGEKITTIIGPNGAGKSTLLRTIYGLTTVTAGRIVVGNEDITRVSQIDRLARGIVMIPQGRSNFPAMTVYENLLMDVYTRRDRDVPGGIDAVMGRFAVL